MQMRKEAAVNLKLSCRLSEDTHHRRTVEDTVLLIDHTQTVMGGNLCH